MKELIKIFKQEKIRVIIKQGNPYFNAQDVCKNLELKNTSQALGGIEKDDIISNDTIDNIEGVKRD
jgi:prophage antirepressor-like protein